MENEETVTWLICACVVPQLVGLLGLATALKNPIKKKSQVAEIAASVNQSEFFHS